MELIFDEFYKKLYCGLGPETFKTELTWQVSEPLDYSNLSKSKLIPVQPAQKQR